MAKQDEVKPIAGGYDFGDEWLNDIEDALDFDTAEEESLDSGIDDITEEMDIIEVNFEDSPADETSNLEDIDMFDAFETFDNTSSAHSEASDDITRSPFEMESPTELSSEDSSTPNSDTPIIEEIDESELKAQTASRQSDDNALGKGRAFTARTLDISELQHQAEIRQKQPESDRSSEDPLKDPQLWQFVSLIAMRLFDDLELLIVQKHCDEACDLIKQLNRLANILAFAGIQEQLPLIAYIGNILPISFTDVEIGEQPERRFDPMKMRSFSEKSNEFLNCLVYLLTYLSQKAVGFDTSRFTDSLERLYSTLNMKPGQPSLEAPLAITDNVNPHELTTRTVNKLSRTLEALVTESLHYIESAVFYGYSSGFEDATKSINNAAQIAHEYHLDDFKEIFARQLETLKKNQLPNTPGQEFYENYLAVCALLESHFSTTITEKKLKHLKTLVSKFIIQDEKEPQVSFSIRWEKFIKAAQPLLDLEKLKQCEIQSVIHKLAEIAREHDIIWLRDTFEHLEEYWDAYTESVAEAFITLADELRAFPTEDIEESDLEHLNHERLKVLFTKKPDAKPQSPILIIKNALNLSEILIQQMENPAMISSAKFQELLIEARQINCHAIARTAEILLSLLERIPRHSDNAAVADSVVNAIYFTAGFLQDICTRLLHFLNVNPLSAAITSRQLFYSALLSLYQTPGKPRDGVTWFIVKRLNDILSELQLVWVNTSTPTSTEYYCALIRRLLQLATICELKDVRTQLLRHLDDIPAQDFINTENQSMNRQCARIIRIIESSCPKLSVLPSSNQVKLFFSKTISALNQLLSTKDADDSQKLNAELSRIESRMSILGLTTDFPPVIAFIYELHYLAYDDNISRKKLEDLLYQLINVANNICPEWIQPKEAELEFVKAPMPIPMPFFQEMLESLSLVQDALQLHANEEPIAWERIQALYKQTKSLINYAPSALQIIAQNAQNRCRYLKKNIFIAVDTNGYPKESDLPVDSVRPVISVAFHTVVDKLIETIIDNAFQTSDNSSRISIVLHPFPNEFSVSITHNGKQFTKQEILDRLNSINIVPVQDENIFDLIVSSNVLMQTYPPTTTLAYILPLLRQFEGRFDVNEDQNGNSRFYIGFKL